MITEVRHQVAEVAVRVAADLAELEITVAADLALLGNNILIF